MRMKIAIAADHAGYELKEFLRRSLAQEGHELLDLGTTAEQPAVDYPDFARKVADAVRTGAAHRGIIVCGSGVGACVAANKVPGIRAGLCHDTFSARQAVEDDDVNVLCLGGRVIGRELAAEVTRVFLGARFSNAERHIRRRDKVTAFEKEFGENKK
jgi:ribose 5-phosphate isomerase B